MLGIESEQFSVFFDGASGDLAISKTDLICLQLCVNSGRS
jgi:hypothetical protein